MVADVNETQPVAEGEVEYQDSKPDDIVFDFLVPGVFLNGIGVLGLVGNVISSIVLSRPQMKSSINCILIGLASFDSILIVTRYTGTFVFVYFTIVY